jgi:hypothetical protein
MTEKQLRQNVADIIESWVGASRGSATHLEILRIYNTHTPLARGYKVQVGDAYCATTVSAAWIAAGISDWTGTECGCDKFIEIAKAKGIWVEDDAHVPKIGEACLYDWDDSGAGDNRGSADHIGIVTSVSGSSFVVTEGNINGGKVGRRPMTVDGKNIRGFIAPDYAMMAAQMSPIQDDEEEIVMDEVKKLIAARKPTRAEIMEATGDQWIETFEDLPPWAKPECRELIEMGALKGVKAGKTVEETVIQASLNTYIRPILVAYRAAKELADQSPKEALAAQMERVAEFLRGE